MCFSPQASFVAGITLTMIGLASIKKAYRSKRNDLLPLAATPLLFGIQQLLEGALWLGLLATPRQESLYTVGLYGFLFFAFFWWPWWIPYSLARCEKNIVHKRILSLFGLAGLALGLYLVWHPFAAQLVDGHIAYSYTITSYVPFYLYIAIIIPPFFMSTLRFIWFLGLLTLTGLIVSIIAYLSWLTSVWCFFAALISTGVYAIIRRIVTTQS